MLKIWGRVNSVNVKKAMWCVEELGLPCERTDAGRIGDAGRLTRCATA